MKSMVKFARFLKKQGYLKSNSADSSKEAGRTTHTATATANTANKGKEVTNNNKQQPLAPAAAESEVTLYKRAVPLEFTAEDVDTSDESKRISTSSEESIEGVCLELNRGQAMVNGAKQNTDGSCQEGGDPKLMQKKQVMLQSTELENKLSDDDITLFQQILDCRLREQRKEVVHKQKGVQQSQQNQNRQWQQPQQNVEDRSRQMLRQAEEAKARMLEVPGKSSHVLDKMPPGRELLHSVLVDEEYTLVEAHLEDHIRGKIVNGEYVDFARLIPRDRLVNEDDKRMEFVVKNGQTFLVPISDRETTVISNFGRWEQAFRVYSTVYSDYYPQRAKELIKYNHTIYHAALSYSWENVYSYDKDFRLHMAKFPSRNWGIILQQAWTLRMRDRVDKGARSGQYVTNNKAGESHNGGQKKTCWKYNSGNCTFGVGCDYEHKCLICGKYGHGAHIVRKAGVGKGNVNKESFSQMTGNSSYSKGRDKDHRHNRYEDKRRR